MWNNSVNFQCLKQFSSGGKYTSFLLLLNVKTDLFNKKNSKLKAEEKKKRYGLDKKDKGGLTPDKHRVNLIKR